MSKTDLLAIVAAPIETIPEGISEGGFTAVLSPRTMLPKMSRKAALKAVVDRQLGLERLMKFGTVMPVLPAVRVAKADIKRAISANIPLLQKLNQTLLGQVQFQVQISFDHKDLPKYAATNLPFRETPASGLRRQLIEAANQKLNPLASDRIDLPFADGLVLNTTLLMPSDHEGALDSALADIDSIWSDGLKIKLTGPSPALSFVSLGVARVGKAEQSTAMARLGLTLPASAADIDRARRATLKLSPQHANAVKAAATIAHAMSRVGPGTLYVFKPWSEGRAMDQSSPGKLVA